MPHTLIRSFIALYPDAEAAQAIASFLACLAGKNRAVKWEKPGQVHITLKFLGDVETSTLHAIARRLDEKLKGSGEVESVIDVTGGFPNLRDPRIVWLGFSSPVNRILDIQRLTEDICEQEGIEREKKRFTPHFTIGRVKSRDGAGDLENDLAACSFHAIPVRAAAVRIMESTLTPNGAIHRERASIILTPGE